MVMRGSLGKGVLSPLVQVIRGWGCPVALHSRVTLSPTSTSVFWGWITKLGRAVRKERCLNMTFPNYTCALQWHFKFTWCQVSNQNFLTAKFGIWKLITVLDSNLVLANTKPWLVRDSGWKAPERRWMHRVRQGFHGRPARKLVVFRYPEGTLLHWALSQCNSIFS